MNQARRILFLDACRGLAALYVAISHVVRERFGLTSGWPGWPWMFGQEAVMVFFLLSGYVIQTSVARAGGSMGAGQFLWRRFLRLYPLIVLALITTYLTVSLARGHFESLRAGQALGNLFALQDFGSVKPGTWCDPYWGNTPLWSLSYECWFYLLFALLHWRVRERDRTTVAGSLSLVAAAVLFLRPNAVAYWATYFVIWWMGRSLAVQTQTESAAAKPERWRAWRWLLAVAGVVLLGAGWHVLEYAGPWRSGTYPLLIVRHFLFAASLATATLLATERIASVVRMAVAPFAVLSSWSYGLYVLHYPLAAGEPWLRDWLPNGWAVVVYVAVAAIVSWWAERRFQPFARAKLIQWTAWRGSASRGRNDRAIPAGADAPRSPPAGR